MDFDTGRRRFLELAGTGTALSLAGCSALQDDAAPQTTAETATTAGSEGGTRRVTVALQADQQALQRRQQEISSELRAGNLTRSEAQQQYQATQQELLSNAVASFTDRVESTASLSVVDSVDQFGVFLVEGSATAVLDTLSFGSVNALLAAETFQQARQQAQRQQQQAQAQTEQSTTTTTTTTNANATATDSTATETNATDSTASN
ncbi:hypothetical protein [Salinigranum halophilum]|uniref:hypothetical protein n=1 Tax=Salinigranum halophilum TaxID=2565931 RepID=UPI0010A8671D|nr:hypothetical protein [Salinigranum halophilum]